MSILNVFIKARFGSVAKFAEGMDVSVPTATRWLQNPDHMTIKAVKKMCEITEIPLSQGLLIAADVDIDVEILKRHAYEH